MSEEGGETEFLKSQKMLKFGGEKDLKKFNPRSEGSVITLRILST